MVFYFILLFTILISILKIEYTYEWSSRELKDALRLHGRTGAQDSLHLALRLPVFFLFFIYIFVLFTILISILRVNYTYDRPGSGKAPHSYTGVRGLAHSMTTAMKE
jgi:ABC-type uncharacterized transport system permease subunit